MSDEAYWAQFVERIVNDELDHLVEMLAPNPGLVNELAMLSVVVRYDAPPDDPDLLGSYLGTPITEQDSSGSLPPLVELYLMPLLDLATPTESEVIKPDVAVLKSEIRITLHHEVGHHLGLDHERLDELGLR
jgi:predicted Zn-dependent protease with MMP-like domain